MSFSAFSRTRAALRAGAPIASRAKTTAFRSTFRRYSTEPPAPKSNTGLYIGIAALVGGGATYFLYDSNAAKSGAQSVKVKANLTPTQEDYQKVRVRYLYKCTWV